MITRPQPGEQSPLARDTTWAVLSTTSDGEFAGAVMPMDKPLDSASQWQGLIDGLLSHVVKADEQAHLEGLYAFTWWSDPEAPEHCGMLMTRLTDTTLETTDVALPDGMIGLMLLITEPQTGQHMATLSLRSYSSPDGGVRPDRVLCSVVDERGNNLGSGIDDRTRTSIRLLGSVLLDMIDRAVPAPDNR